MTEGHGVDYLVFGCWVLARAVAISIEATLFEWWGEVQRRPCSGGVHRVCHLWVEWDEGQDSAGEPAVVRKRFCDAD